MRKTFAFFRRCYIFFTQKRIDHEVMETLRDQIALLTKNLRCLFLEIVIHISLAKIQMQHPLFCFFSCPLPNDSKQYSFTNTFSLDLWKLVPIREVLCTFVSLETSLPCSPFSDCVCTVNLFITFAIAFCLIYSGFYCVKGKKESYT